MKDVINFIISNWEWLGAAVLWVAARLIPTKKNYDVIQLIVNFIGDHIIPNIKKDDQPTNLRNKIKRRHSGRIGVLIILFAFIPLLANAQLNGNFKSVRFVNVTDSTTVLPINGSIYYNEQVNQFRAYENGAWVDLIDTGSSFTLTDGNGTTANGTAVDLGGTLTAASTELNLGSAGNALSIFGDDGFGGRDEIFIGSGGAGLQLRSYSGHPSTHPDLLVDTYSGIFSIISQDRSTGTDDYSLTFSSVGPGSLIFTDNRSTKLGIQYAGDYTLDFTARSLVDKAYVDAQSIGTSSGSNNRVAVYSSTTDIEGDTNFTWDATNLNIGAAGVFNTGISWGDGDTYLQEGSDDALKLDVSSARTLNITQHQLEVVGVASDGLNMRGNADGVTTFDYSFRDDQNTGMHRTSDGRLSFFVDATNGFEVWDNSDTTTITKYNDTVREFLSVVTTSDATVTTLSSITLDDESVYRVSCEVIGRDQAGTSAERAFYNIEGLFYREGGGAIQESTTTVISSIESTGTLDASFDTNSNDVRLRVTGLAATTINWQCVLTFSKLQ